VGAAALLSSREEAEVSAAVANDWLATVEDGVGALALLQSGGGRGDEEDSFERALERALAGGGGGRSTDGSDGREQRREVTITITKSASSTGAGVVGALLAANMGVWLAWKAPVAAVRAFLERNFLTSPGHMGARGWPWGWATCLWSTYSHESFMHLLFNMLGLGSFGPGLMDPRVHSVATPALSAVSFLGMYHTAGVLGSVGSNFFAAACGSSRPALGASGAVFGVITYHALCHPASGVILLFFVHTDAATALGLGTLINVGLVVRAWQTARAMVPGPSIDGMAHLVGTGVGAAWYGGSRAYAFSTGAPPRSRVRSSPRSTPPPSYSRPRAPGTTVDV
jgi:membrane associated rhomboid family serine protease